VVNWLFRIRWAFYAKTFDAASTMRTLAGRARACGPLRAIVRPFHDEGGKGNKPLLIKSQLRPDPLRSIKRSTL